MIEKIVFGALLIFAFQFPVFAVQYEQFLSGFFEATKLQAEGYEQTAARNEFGNVRAMINKHLQNSEPSVQEIASNLL